MNIKTPLLVLLSVLLLFRGSAQADFSFSLSPSSPTFVEGNPVFVDVLLSSNSMDALDGFSANFSLSGGAGLQFTAPQAESHLTNTSYVFYNRSNSLLNSLPSTVVNSASSMNVSDVSDNGMGGSNPFSVGGVGSESLLARLNLGALSAGNYTLELLNTSSFSDVGFNNFIFNTPSLSITVAAVPEPTSVLTGLGLGMIGLMHRRRRRSLRIVR